MQKNLQFIKMYKFYKKDELTKHTKEIGNPLSFKEIEFIF